MDKLKYLMAFLFAALAATAAQAQDAQEDVMRSNGKIYVVMAVVVTIVIGLFIYLVSLDRKISRVEKKES